MERQFGETLAEAFPTSSVALLVLGFLFSLLGLRHAVRTVR